MNRIGCLTVVLCAAAVSSAQTRYSDVYAPATRPALIKADFEAPIRVNGSERCPIQVWREYVSTVAGVPGDVRREIRAPLCADVLALLNAAPILRGEDRAPGYEDAGVPVVESDPPDGGR